jgi:hypothetical protein
MRSTAATGHKESVRRASMMVTGEWTPFDLAMRIDRPAGETVRSLHFSAPPVYSETRNSPQKATTTMAHKQVCGKESGSNMA